MRQSFDEGTGHVASDRADGTLLADTAGTKGGNISRRSFVAAAIAAPAILSGCGGRTAADFDLRLGSNLPPSHPIINRFREAAGRVEAASQGKVRIQIFPASQLGADTDMLSQVRSGAIHFLSLSGLVASMLVPTAAVSGIGFAFHDRTQLFHAMDGELGAIIRGAFAEKDLFAFPRPFENGFRQITTARQAIRQPSDLYGLKIRVPLGAMWTTMFSALGATPTSINFSETYTALQTHLVDGQENPLIIVENAKLTEVQRFCSMTNHMWDGFWLLSNKGLFESFPPWLRELLKREFGQAALQEREDLALMNADLPARLKQAGMEFTWPDRALFREKLRAAGFYRHWRDRLGEQTWSALQNAVGGLS